MTSENRPQPLTGESARQLLAAAPPWARAMQPRREADGRVVLVGEADGCYVWVQPKAWSSMTFQPADAPHGDAAGTMNYGLQMGDIAAHRGQLQTNDSGFGRALLGARTGAESPLPDASGGPAPATSGTVYAAAILAVGFVLAALVARFKRRAS